MADIIQGKLHETWLSISVKAGSRIKEMLELKNKNITVSELMLLLNKFTIINCSEKKSEIITTLFSSVRETTNENYLEREVIDGLIESHPLSYIEDKENI